jgi:MYXO-CTERM domain-containing protein
VPCDPDIEMSCPSGRECVCGLDPENPTECFCVPETEECGEDVCTACERCVSEVCVEIDCPDCQTCQLATGRCVDDCAGVSCDPGLVCSCGVCEVPNCYAAGFECPAGQQCEDGTCVEDPCYEVSCAPPQFCRDGACHDPCDQEDVCPTGQVCFDGECVEDPCWMVSCPNPGEVCADGECSTLCADVECASPLECEPATGECEEPACWDIRCPDGYDCLDGTCVERAHPADDTDAGDGGGEAGTGQQVLATGAGGCACRTTAPEGRAGGVLVLLALVGFGLRRRSRKGE